MLWLSPLLAVASLASASANSRFSASSSAPITLVPPTYLSSCAELGFSPTHLACRTCKLIEDALGQDHVSTVACENCCAKSLDVLDGPLGSKHRLFVSAALHVCKASATGGVNEWLEKASSTWIKRGGVTIVNECKGGGASIILYTKEKEEEGIVVPVSTWRHEDMSSFLEASLKSNKIGECDDGPGRNFGEKERNGL